MELHSAEQTLFDFCEPKDRFNAVLYRIEKLQNSYDNLRRGFFSRYAELLKEINDLKIENQTLKNNKQNI